MIEFLEIGSIWMGSQRVIFAMRLENRKEQPCDSLVEKQPRLRKFKSKGPKMGTIIMDWRNRKKSNVAGGHRAFRIAFLYPLLKLIFGVGDSIVLQDFGHLSYLHTSMRKSGWELQRNGRGGVGIDGSRQSGVMGRTWKKGQIFSQFSKDQQCYTIL